MENTNDLDEFREMKMEAFKKMHKNVYGEGKSLLIQYLFDTTHNIILIN